MKFHLKMLRISKLLIFGGILLLQGCCSSSKVTQPSSVESKIKEQAPELPETTKGHLASEIQKDSQALSTDLTLKQTELAERAKTPKLSEQRNQLIEKTENTSQVAEKSKNPLPKAKMALSAVETDLKEQEIKAKSSKIEAVPNTEIDSPNWQPKQLQQPTASVIQIEDPWVRAVPPNANNSAIFLDLRNESEQLRKLVEVHSEVAEQVELHMTKDEDGMLRKERLEEVLIPALETQSFHPGGIHIMLIGLRSPLNVGGAIELELVYADQSKETISVPVDERPLLPITAQNNHSLDLPTTRTQ